MQSSKTESGIIRESGQIATSKIEEVNKKLPKTKVLDWVASQVNFTKLKGTNTSPQTIPKNLRGKTPKLIL